MNAYKRLGTTLLLGCCICTASPALATYGFSWNTHGFPWSQLWISRNGTTYHTQWVNTGTAATGTWTTTWTLPPGSYSWWVRGWSSTTGYSFWRGPTHFTMLSQIPGTLTQIAPSGLREGTQQMFRWNKDARATFYQLYINTSTGQNVYGQWYEETGSGEMSRTLTGFHGGRSYQWWVRGWSPHGTGPWSNGLAFSIASNAPAKPTTVSPSGTVTTTRPVFRWNTAARATWYRIYVQRGSTGVIDRWVQGTQLSSPVALAPVAGHTWWIGAWNQESGQTVWSDARSFTVSASALAAEYEARVHSLVNNYRTSNGRAAMTYNSNIAAIARQHSQAAANGTISNTQFIQHLGSDGRFTQIRAFVTWSSISENVAYNQGYSDPSWKTVDQWKNSSAHNTNMLNSTWNRTGVGAAVSANGTWYFTQIYLRTP